MAKLQAAERELALYRSRDQRDAQGKRQKTMESFLSEKTRGLPTRPAHFHTDISNAKGYSESDTFGTSCFEG